MTPRDEFDMLRGLQRNALLAEWCSGAKFGASKYVRRRLLRRMAVLSVLLCALSPAEGHESWISRQGLRNGAGEWCCGDVDCPVLNYTPRVTPSGYVLKDGEVVPFTEAQPSPDGTYVRCHRPDGTRRCFFAPRPNS